MKKYANVIIIFIIIIILPIFYFKNNIIDIFKTNFINKDNNQHIYKVAFVGDMGISTSTIKNLQNIKKENAQALVILGDFDYTDNPKFFEKMLDDNLGRDFPVLPVAGNHEDKKWFGDDINTYDNFVKNKINKLQNLCNIFDIGLNYECKIGPLHIVFISPDINIKQKVNKYADFISLMFTKDDNIKIKDKNTWNICAFHKNNIDYKIEKNRQDNIDINIYDNCRKNEALILNGHDHSYARSKTVLSFKEKLFSTSTKDLDKNIIELKDDKTGLIIAGMGGKSLRDGIGSKDITWNKTYSKDYGILFCEFPMVNMSTKKPNQARCYMQNISGENIDEFLLIK